jgi:hypothetical protein
MGGYYLVVFLLLVFSTFLIYWILKIWIGGFGRLRILVVASKSLNILVIFTLYAGT